MKWLLALFLLPRTFQPALPGYHYEFPRDHFNHPEYRTEWWYYTGNLKAADGREFGFELTFFRQGNENGGEGGLAPAWRVNDLYLAHLALTDLANKRFVYRERLNRPGPGLAGADAATGRIWNGNWQVKWSGEDQSLQAFCDEFSIQLSLHPEKPPVIHGRNGVSQKSEGAGHASHYVSFSRLSANGSITAKGRTSAVSGFAWMDHEFFTGQLDASQAGWDWMSVQLENGEDLMIYRLRKKDGTGDSFSSGTYIDPSGKPTMLNAADFRMTPETTWKSPATGASYPIRWTLEIPKLKLKLNVTTPLDSQELTSETVYWEGAVRYAGQRDGRPVRGAGYLEMTGYGKALELSR